MIECNFLKTLLPLSIIYMTCLFLSCTNSTRLMTGTWSGIVTPQKHPEMQTLITYTVDYVDDELEIVLNTPDGVQVPVTDISLDRNTLKFHFLEPDANVPLNCLLKGNEQDGFKGKCTDVDGKWATFTLVPSK